MNKLFVFLSMMMVICASNAQIYKWIDSQGNVHFSDMPHQGAEIITIPDGQSYSPPASQTPNKIEQQQNPEKLKHDYSNIAIAQPEGGATIRNNQGFVKVIAQIEPDLFPGDKVQLVYDNVAIGEPQKDLVFEMNGMYRGSHTLAVQVVGADGSVIGSSDSITIYVFRPRVGMVPGTRPH